MIHGDVRIQVPVNVNAELAALKNLYVMEALREADGNRQQAAALLGVCPRTFMYWLRQMEARTYRIADAEFGPLAVAPETARLRGAR